MKIAKPLPLPPTSDRRTQRMRRILDNQVVIMRVLHEHISLSHGANSKGSRLLLEAALADTAKVQQ